MNLTHYGEPWLFLCCINSYWIAVKFGKDVHGVLIVYPNDFGGPIFV